jgi:2-polyprenyl-3-methyl-5-hydroxy-6-metoxy-1,4-benzoquinol methylase
MEEFVRQPDGPEKLHDFFIQCLENEEKRKELASSGQFERLKELYSAAAVHLPGMNSSLKWDFYSYRDFDTIDRITTARIRAVIDQIPAHAEVLDYGCGYGYVLGQALTENKRWQYTGIDFSKKFISKLRLKYPESRFLACDLTEIKDKQFDAVLLLEVLEHIPSSQTLEFLATVKTKIKDTGKLIISVPLFEDIAESTCPCWSCGKLGNPNGHVRSYTPDLIQAEFLLSGFTVEKTIEIFSKNKQIAIWKNRVKRMLGMEKSKPSNLVIVAH